jgi:hypothetical protein
MNHNLIPNIKYFVELVNPLNSELNPIRHLLALAGAYHFVDVSRIRVIYFLCMLEMTETHTLYENVYHKCIGSQIHLFQANVVEMRLYE